METLDGEPPTSLTRDAGLDAGRSPSWLDALSAFFLWIFALSNGCFL